MKRSGSDWWKLYHDDFWESEVVLLAEPDVAAVYLFLLGIQAKHGELPGDVRAVRALCSRFPDELWARAWAVLEACFPKTGDGARANGRQASLLSEVDRDRVRARARQRASRRVRGDAPLSQVGHTNVTAQRHADVTPERRGEERRGEVPTPQPPEDGGDGHPPNGRSKPKPPDLTAQVPGLVAGTELDTSECVAALQDWLRHKRERGQSYKPMGLRALIREAMKIGPAGLRAAVDHCMAGNYAGLFAAPARNGHAAPRKTTYDENMATLDSVCPKGAASA